MATSTKERPARAMQVSAARAAADRYVSVLEGERSRLATELVLLRSQPSTREPEAPKCGAPDSPQQLQRTIECLQVGLRFTCHRSLVTSPLAALTSTRIYHGNPVLDCFAVVVWLQL